MSLEWLVTCNWGNADPLFPTVHDPHRIIPDGIHHMAEIHQLRRAEDVPAAIPVKRRTHETSRAIDISIHRKILDDLPDKSDLLLIQAIVIDERRKGLLRRLRIELRDSRTTRPKGFVAYAAR